MNPILDKEPSVKQGWGVLSIVGIYVALASLWILTSDKVLAILVSDPEQRIEWSIYKGWLFVAVTAGILYGLITRHVSRLRNTHSKLLATESRFRELVESANSVICQLDLHGSVVFINNYGEKLFGFAPDEMAGKPALGHILPAHFITGEIGADLAEQIQKNPALYHYLEGLITTRDNKKLFVAWTFRLMTEPSGIISGILCIGQDISARKEAEESRLILEERLRQSQKMEAIGTLAGGIAHDFNNILNVMVGNLSLARMDLDNRTALVEEMDEIERAVERAKALVQQILTFSRRSKTERKNMSLDPVLREALKMLRATLPTTIEIKYSSGVNVPPVCADAGKIHQVLVNLATNSAHAMQGKTGRIEVHLSEYIADVEFTQKHPDLTQSHYALLSVADTGSGMEPEILKRIFEPFFTTKAPGQGTGLGLAVVHGILKEHHAGLDVSSEIGKGTVFRLYFPASEGPIQEDNAINSDVPRGQGQRLLVVDDDQQLLQTLEKCLTNLGYKIVAHTQPGKALEEFRLHSSEFDLVLTDLTMPLHTGADVAKEILAIRPDIPVVLCTGFSNTWSDEELFKLGVRQVIHKPFEIPYLAQSLSKIFKG